MDESKRIRKLEREVELLKEILQLQEKIAELEREGWKRPVDIPPWTNPCPQPYKIWYKDTGNPVPPGELYTTCSS